jgi:hypothetical protein
MNKSANIIFITLIAVLLSLFSACSTINQATSTNQATFVNQAASTNQAVSTSNTYWDENSAGTIETNDISRLQKEVPFEIILPEYLPDGLKSYKLVMILVKINQVSNLHIDYYFLASGKEIHMLESPPSDLYPQPLTPDILAEMNPGYTPLELGGIEVIEKSGFGDVIWSGQKNQVPAFLYLWEQNNLLFSGRILGYDQAEARKVIESMTK